MKRMSVTAMAAAVVVPCSLLFGTAGCEREVADELVTVSGAYLGEMVSVVATAFLHEAFGAESADAHDEAGHDTEPLHDHEH
jgi:hypothetical protein